MLARLMAFSVLMVLITSPASAARIFKPVAGSGAGDHLIVKALLPGMPAKELGVLPGDTLLQIGGERISSSRTLTAHLRGLGKKDSAELLVGRPDGRSLLRVVGDRKTKRLGVDLLGTIMSDSSVALVSETLSVGAAVGEFGEGTYVRVDVRNNGSNPIDIGPDSVVALTATGGMLSSISPQDLLTLKFGGDVTDVAGMTHRGMGDAIASGIMSGWAKGTREAYTRSILENALKQTRIPASASYGGAVFYAKKKFELPMRVVVSVAGKSFVMFFDAPTTN